MVDSKSLSAPCQVGPHRLKLKAIRKDLDLRGRKSTSRRARRGRIEMRGTAFDEDPEINSDSDPCGDRLANSLSDS